jgi:mRNA interferase RelE/StbE
VKFRLVYTNRAVKDIASLNPQTKERIKEALERYSEAPGNYAKRMVDPVLGTYRFRIGDYRVIFDIEGNDIVVLRIGHRRDIYRR